MVRKTEWLNREAADEIERLRAAILKVTAALNEGRIVPRSGVSGVSGMTIEAQLRNSVYTGVPAWPIEDARKMLDEINSRAARAALADQPAPERTA